MPSEHPAMPTINITPEEFDIFQSRSDVRSHLSDNLYTLQFGTIIITVDPKQYQVFQLNKLINVITKARPVSEATKAAVDNAIQVITHV